LGSFTPGPKSRKSINKPGMKKEDVQTNILKQFEERRVSVLQKQLSEKYQLS